MRQLRSAEDPAGDTILLAVSEIDNANGLPLSEAFARAVEQNERYYAERRGRHYTSPLFKLVQCLRSHPGLKDHSAEDALGRITEECKPDWEHLFPNASVPSLEFITAWDQVKFPTGTSPWEIAQERVRRTPVTLLRKPACEGYEQYLGIAFHLQCLTPRQDILLPVKPVSKVLTAVLGKDVSEQSVSGYCRLAKTNGYVTLTAMAHHPSGKAARYKFALTRFTEDGVELNAHADVGGSGDTPFTYGSHGIEGNEGTDGIDGISGIETSTNSVLTHAGGKIPKATGKAAGEEKSNTKPEEQPDMNLKDILKAKQAQPAISLAGHWQKRMALITKTVQPLMTAKGAAQLKRAATAMASVPGLDIRKVLDLALEKWDHFGVRCQTEKGLFHFPSTPTIGFFSQYWDVAANMYLQSIAKPVVHVNQAQEDLKTARNFLEHPENVDANLLEWAKAIVASHDHTLPAPKPIVGAKLTEEEYQALMKEFTEGAK